ncbi:hypothetical protein QFC21_002705 [Naganishia friedmannii]|uniref:Uncharacterized protein n=1 Tax=Naganishia friedmannii TaxID=89922 RepID=A0ACC2VVB4_9TREE|nr:hypothetical protein QFC21_002705 [Naganishia friedmannii]
MQSSSPLTPPLPSSSLPETDQQTHHLCATRGTKRKVSGPAATEPFVGGAKEDLTQNRGSGGPSANRKDGGVMPKTPTKKRIEYVIDLCTPSPAAASKFSDPLGLNIAVIAPNVAAPSKRTPLAQVAIPNQPSLIASALATLAEKQQELQRSNYEGYLSLCRLTRQASQRSVSGSAGGGVAGIVRRMSVSRMEVSSDTTMQDSTALSASSPPPFARSLLLVPESAIASATTTEMSNERLATETAPRETEQQKQTRLAAWKSRNAHAVMACSRNASRARAMAPGKAMTSWQVATRGRETTTVPDTEMEVDVPKLRTAGGMDESIPPPSPPMTNNLATRPQPVALTDNLSQTQTRYLEQFVSHQHSDAYRVDPNPEHSGFRRREWSPVYACAYTHAAKRGGVGPKVLALASESGTIKLIDTNHNSSSASTTASPSTTQFYPHSNAIFDLQWDEADERILTASGDQLGAVHRLTEGGDVRREAVLSGHTSSVKTCAWYDQNTVLTAGRDGNIHIYDLRCTGAFTSDLGIDETRYNRGRAAYGAYWDQARISPVMSVRNAHGVGGGSGRKVTSPMGTSLTDPNSTE